MKGNGITDENNKADFVKLLLLQVPPQFYDQAYYYSLDANNDYPVPSKDDLSFIKHILKANKIIKEYFNREVCDKAIEQYFYFVNFLRIVHDLSGLTIYPYVFINNIISIMLNDCVAEKKNDAIKIYFLMVMLQEFIHYFSLTEKEDHNSFDTYNNKAEGGSRFEVKIFGREIKYLTMEEGMFISNPENWNYSKEVFREKFGRICYSKEADNKNIIRFKHTDRNNEIRFGKCIIVDNLK
jgi:hypothetical protein